MNLALKYRPQVFEDVVGQKAPSAILKAMLGKNVLSNVLLFQGPSGVGKTSMARIVAAELNPEAKEDVHNGIHPAVLEIDAASNGSVEAIRKLKRDLQFSVTFGRRVVIIDEAQAMSEEAFAALLNLLEFPSESITIILLTTEINRIPKTIRHRCDMYTFKRASVEDLLDRLKFVNSEEGYEVSGDLLNLIAQRSEGSYRESLMLLEQVAVAGIKTVGEYNELQGEADYGPSLLHSALDGPVSALHKLEGVLRYTSAEEISERTVETLRDVMLLKGGIKLTHSAEALNVRNELAAKLGISQILKAMTIMWDLQTKLSAGDPVRGLELAYSLIGDAFKPEIVLSVPTPDPTSNNRMSFDAMKNYIT
jgi:DNA polymerase III subunit gamma/tau